MANPAVVVSLGLSVPSILLVKRRANRALGAAVLERVVAKPHTACFTHAVFFLAMFPKMAPFPVAATEDSLVVIAHGVLKGSKLLILGSVSGLSTCVTDPLTVLNVAFELKSQLLRVRASVKSFQHETRFNL